MDFSASPASAELVAQYRRFVDEVVIPVEGGTGSFADRLPALGAARDRARADGLWLPQIPSEYGGRGLGFLDLALVSEQLGRSPYGHFAVNAQAPDAGNMEILMEYGTDEQRATWLVPLAAGAIRSCFSMTEPDRAGSNPVNLDTTAVVDGDAYVLNGHKWFTTAADGAAFAVVMAITNPGAEPHARASQLIVPTDTPGFEHVRNIPCFGHAGDGWESHAEIRFTNCCVPVANRLGDEGAGFAIAQSRLGPGRIHHCMRWIGVAERCFDLMCHRAATREVAPGEALGTRQAVQHAIAESRSEIDAARLLVLHAAWRIDREGARAARVEISSIKYHVAKVMLDVVDRAIQVHGALGITDDTILATFYRQERGSRIYDGPDEVHKNVVARHALRAHGLSL